MAKRRQAAKPKADVHAKVEAFLGNSASSRKNRAIALATELAKRETESLKLYEPLAFQDSFHRCTAFEAILQKGNRAGGSLAGFVEVARAVTGQDPYGKYPEKDGTAICLGYGEKHIGRVMHRYLFEPGAFYIVRDPETGKWRTYRRWQDQHLEHLKVPAPPLIPRRFIQRRQREDGSVTSQDGIIWEKRGERVFSRVNFTTGWTLYAANSAGDASQFQGFDVHLYHIDEDLATGGWYEEAVARVSAVDGLIRWTAMPHDETPDIARMIERGEEQEGKDDPTTVVIRASQDENPHLNPNSMVRAQAVWAAMGDDALRKRKYGDLVTTTSRMYPTFSDSLHNAIRPEDDRQHPIQKVLSENNGVPPHDWCRYAWTDPGHTIAGTLFIAIPPPGLGDRPVVYDEIYIHRCDPRMWANAFKAKAGRFHFQAFGMDAHGGRLTSLTDGRDPRTAYKEALSEVGVKSVDTGHSFKDGSDNIPLREQKVRELVGMRPDGFPGFFVVSSACPNFCREMKHFKKKTIKVAGEKITTDTGDRRANTHLVECFEYFAADDAKYIRPPSTQVDDNYARRRIAERKTRRAAMRARKGEIDKLVGGKQAVYLEPGG